MMLWLFANGAFSGCGSGDYEIYLRIKFLHIEHNNLMETALSRIMIFIYLLRG